MTENAKPVRQMTVGQLLAQVCRMSGHRIRLHMEKLGLHPGQGFALIHLMHGSGLSQRDLARTMHVSPASVTHKLQRMERDGWIERRRDPSDQRIVRVYPTEKAKQLRSEVKLVFQEMENDLNSIYSPAEQATLKRLLLRMYEHFAPGDPHPDHIHRFLQDEEG